MAAFAPRLLKSDLAQLQVNQFDEYVKAVPDPTQPLQTKHALQDFDAHVASQPQITDLYGASNVDPGSPEAAGGGDDPVGRTVDFLKSMASQNGQQGQGSTQTTAAAPEATPGANSGQLQGQMDAERRRLAGTQQGPSLTPGDVVAGAPAGVGDVIGAGRQALHDALPPPPDEAAAQAATHDWLAANPNPTGRDVANLLTDPTNPINQQSQDLAMGVAGGPGPGAEGRAAEIMSHIDSIEQLAAKAGGATRQQLLGVVRNLRSELSALGKAAPEASATAPGVAAGAPDEGQILPFLREMDTKAPGENFVKRFQDAVATGQPEPEALRDITQEYQARNGTGVSPQVVPPGEPPASTPTKPTALDTILSIWNLPKALKASLDLSAPFRQGVLLAADKPREFAGAFGPMLRAAKSNEFAQKLDAAIRVDDRPNLYLAPLDSTNLGAREEAFMSNLANKIPGMAASNRAYVTFLNKLRVDVYDSVTGDLASAGRDLSDAEKSGIADVINHFTGRGDLPRMGDKSTAVLNGAFFSPRFAISRVQSIGDALGVLKGLIPGQVATPASQFAARAMAKSVGAGLTILGLAKLAGADVEADPRSSSFGKIVVGPNSYDIWGGEQQIARNVAQLVMGQQKNLASGQIQDVPRLTTLGVDLGQPRGFLQSKLSPSAATALGVVRGPSSGAPTGSIGTGYGYQPFSAVDLVNPMSQQSLTGALGLQDVVQGGPAGLPSLLGVGYQNQNAGGTDRSFVLPLNTSGRPAAPKPPSPPKPPGRR